MRLICGRVVEVSPQGDPNNAEKFLKLPSGEMFRVIQIEAVDENTYQTIEVSEWVELAKDWAQNPARLRTKAKQWPD